MNGGLIFRTVVTTAALLSSLWLLTPSFLPADMQAEILRVAALAELKEPPADAPPPATFTKFLPSKVLVYGLDIEGGLDLTLEVEVEEAVRSVVQRDIQPLKAAAVEKGVKLAEVRRARGEAALLVSVEPGTTLEQVKEIVASRLSGYTYTITKEEAGKSWMTFALSDTRAAEIRAQAVDQARDVIENRINATGTKEPQITRKGETGISLQLPGETDIERAVAAIGTTAKLEFMLVEDDVDRDAVAAALVEAKAALPSETYLHDEQLSEWLEGQGAVKPGNRLMWEYDVSQKPAVRTVWHVVEYVPLLTGEDVNNAHTQLDERRGQWVAIVDFKPNGSMVFAEVTGNNKGRQLAIVLDGQVRSAPGINERISGSAQISVGGSTLAKQYEDASMLSLVLRTGALPAPVSVGETRQVGPQLGQRAIREGALAAGIGSGLVLLFAAFYYRVSGVLADLSLILNALMVLACMVTFGATLTLPGICGIALTIGMAVDCNIIIFERIREELRAGRSVHASIEAGFDRAFVAVFDSNLTTLLAGIVLFSYGSGPLRGFAVTLMIGIFTTLFTGVFVSRTLMELAGERFGSRLSI